MQITVKNWKKYNPRADRANYTWFRFENRFFSEPDIFDLSASQKMLFVFILCEASKKNTDVIKFSSKMAAAMVGESEGKILSDLTTLSDLVSVSRQNDGKSPGVIPATNVTNITNERNEHTSAPSAQDYALEFLESWKEYPLKKGKQEAYKAWRKIPESKRGLVLAACKSYFSECRMTGKLPRFMQHMSTFLNSGRWQDYHDPEVQEAIVTGVVAETKSHWDIQREKIERGEI